MSKLIKICAFLFGLMALASCGGGGSGSGHPYGIPAQFDDADPVVWKGHVPSKHPVHGVDVSRYQGDIDWPLAANSGVNFAFIKATEGIDIADPKFAENWRQTAQAGVPRGAYHFYYFCRTGADQANWFIQNVPREAGALPPALDLEWTQTRNCARPDKDEARAQVLAFLNIVTQYYGQRPIIYTSVDFYNDNELWDVDGYQFWLRSVAAHPKKPFKGQNWSFWQYTGTGLAPGFNGQVDLNAFVGNEKQWANWLATHRT